MAAVWRCANEGRPSLRGRVVPFINEHQDEDLSLSEVAKAVNMSAFYFCKIFKRATGLTFTEYLARVRVETVKQVLLDPHKRVSEAAYASGFQSLSQFNRVFRRITGQAPSEYKQRLHGPASIQGKPGQCPECGSRFRIPTYEGVSAEEKAESGIILGHIEGRDGSGVGVDNAFMGATTTATFNWTAVSIPTGSV